MDRKDIIEVVKTKSGRIVLLSSAQWAHIIESHSYMAGNMDKVIETVSDPDFIVSGFKGELIALKYYEKTNITEKNCAVVYKELESQGFIITAFFTSRPETIKRKGVLWKK